MPARAHEAITSRFISEFLLFEFLSGFSSVAFDYPKQSTRQWNYIVFNSLLGTRFAGIMTYPNTVGPCIPCIKWPSFLKDPVVLLGAVRYPISICYFEESNIWAIMPSHIGLTVERIYLAEKTYTIA